MRKSGHKNSMLVGTTNFHIEANERSSRIVPLYDDHINAGPFDPDVFHALTTKADRACTSI